MKISIKLVVMLVVGAVIVGGVFVYLGSRKSDVAYTTATVSKNDLIQTVEATGSVSSAEDLILSFKRSGKIGTLLAKIGDSVTQGQRLASIIDAPLLSEVDRARAAVQSAQADLDRLQSGATPEERAVKEQSVEKARVALSSAESTLNNALQTENQTTTVYVDTALQDITDALFVANYTLNVVYDGILDADAQVIFATSNTNALLSANHQYSVSVAAVSDAGTYHQSARTTQSVADTLLALQKTRSALDNIVILLDHSLSALNGAVVSPFFTQAMIDALKTSFNTRASAIGTEKTSVQTSINNLTTGLQTLSSSVQTATFGVQTAERNLELAEAELTAFVAPPEAYDIRQQQARLLQAQADLRSAESKLDDIYITAPINGTITAVDKEIGENANLNETVIRMFGESRLLIDVDISESDINKVVVGMPADITLDAFGSDTSFSGNVSFIEPSERVIQDVVYYRVTVVFTDDNDQVKPGMTADVTIKTAERQGVLTLPIRAIVISPTGEKTVRVLENSIPSERIVTTGIRGDDGSVEVMSGVQEGDIVITGEQNGK